jgi:monoamine oxidase
MEEIAANVFRAHKKAIEDDLFDYSESMYLREALHLSTNITDQIDSTGDYFPAWPYENVYFSATTWKTIDKGLTSLPKAFGPLVSNRTTFGIPVSALSFNETTQKISAHWRPTTSNPFALETSSLEFDYAIIAAPFSKVRLWRLPAYSSLLSRAIKTLNYQQACKVALHYKTRFWEHLEYPIIGGCGETNIPGIGSICYPSYKINSTLPGVLLASYNSGVEARTLASMSEIDHVALVQRAMIETHGPIAGSEFTGAYDRICWENDPYQAGAWCSPLVGQEELYLPAYYQTEFKTIFVGEHTSFTHAWIFSALESAVRGTAQLLLDMGLVDEAKEVTGVWMARWMKM